MTYGSINVDSITSSTGGVSSPGAPAFKNRILNGAMTIDQRNNGASVTPVDAQYTVDRWRASATQTGKFTVQQNAGSITPPPGFSTYVGVTSTSAYAVTSSDTFGLLQLIEGSNVSDLGFGTANAQNIVVSFWVRSSLTGAFGGAILNGTFQRSYPFSYSIPAANTWTKVSVSIPGDTATPSGYSWATNSSAGLVVEFGLGNGSTYSGAAGAWATANYLNATGATSVVGTSGATFYITGVQLEKGTVATSFDFRSIGQELALCQRYYITYGGYSNYEPFGVGVTVGTTAASIQISLPVSMRAQPSVAFVNIGSWTIQSGSTSITPSAISLDQTGLQQVMYTATISGGTNGYAARAYSNLSTGTRIQLSAEL